MSDESRPLISAPPSGPLTLLAGMRFCGMGRLCDIFDTHPDVVLRREPEMPALSDIVPEFCLSGDIECHRGVAEAYLRGLAAAASRKRPASQQESAAEMAGSGPPHLVLGSHDVLGRLPLLATAWPGLRVVLVVRNPFGHVAAMLRRFARDGETALPRSAGLMATEQAKSYGLSEDDFGSMKVIDQFVWDWVIRHEIAIDGLAEIPEWRIVRRRELVDDPVLVAKALFKFAGLAWNPRSAIEKSDSLRWTGDWLQGSKAALPDEMGNILADPFVQAFDDMTRPLYGTTSFYGQRVAPPRYDWETDLDLEDRERILGLVRSTTLHHVYPELADWANVG